MHSPEESLRKMGIELPDPVAPKGIYRNVLVSGNLVMPSGHLPCDANGNLMLGKQKPWSSPKTMSDKPGESKGTLTP